jgi:hypothetical protein
MFTPSKINKDGYEGSCRRCRAVSRKEPKFEWPWGEGYKRCTQCEEIKPVNLFTAQSRGRYGVTSRCKECMSGYHRNRETLPKITALPIRQCSKCGEEKPLEMFNKHKKQRDGYSTRCISCDRAYREENRQAIKNKTREYKSRNRKKVKHSYQQWHAANPHYLQSRRIANPDRYRAYDQARRARVANVGGRGVTAQDIQAMIYIQQGLCAYCERDGQKLTLDHIVPLDQKGLHDPDNCCMCCGVCNSSKGNRTPEEWQEAGRWFD